MVAKMLKKIAMLKEGTFRGWPRFLLDRKVAVVTQVWSIFKHRVALPDLILHIHRRLVDT